MLTGLPVEYWERLYERDERLIATVYELARIRAGGKPRRSKASGGGIPWSG